MGQFRFAMASLQSSEMIALADGLHVNYSWRAGRIPIGRSAGYWTYLIGTSQTSETKI